MKKRCRERTQKHLTRQTINLLTIPFPCSNCSSWFNDKHSLITRQYHTFLETSTQFQSLVLSANMLVPDSQLLTTSTICDQPQLWYNVSVTKTLLLRTSGSGRSRPGFQPIHRFLETSTGVKSKYIVCAGALIQWLFTHVQKVMSWNPSTGYWMDISTFICCKNVSLKGPKINGKDAGDGHLTEYTFA